MQSDPIADLFEAIRGGDADRVADLLDADPTLLGARLQGISPILFALYVGHAELVPQFVDAGARVSFAEACAMGEEGRVAEMLDDDASLVNRRSEDGFPPIGLAIFFHHPGVARLLIERGADVSAAAENRQRVAPVHAAATVADHDSMRLLLTRGADPNARQESGYVALHSAAMRGDVEMAKLLLAHGADRDARTDDGKSARDIATEHQQSNFVDWLQGT